MELSSTTPPDSAAHAQPRCQPGTPSVALLHGTALGVSAGAGQPAAQAASRGTEHASRSSPRASVGKLQPAQLSLEVHGGPPALPTAADLPGAGGRPRTMFWAHSPEHLVSSFRNGARLAQQHDQQCAPRTAPLHRQACALGSTPRSKHRSRIKYVSEPDQHARAQSSSHVPRRETHVSQGDDAAALDDAVRIPWSAATLDDTDALSGIAADKPGSLHDQQPGRSSSRERAPIICAAKRSADDAGQPDGRVAALRHRRRRRHRVRERQRSQECADSSAKPARPVKGLDLALDLDLTLAGRVTPGPFAGECGAVHNHCKHA